MKKLLAVILQPPIPALLGLTILSLVIYYGGGAVRSWHRWDDSTLLIIVGCVWLLAGLLFVWRRIQSARRARMIEDRLRGQAREHIESVRPDKRSQVEELEKQLSTALTTLQKSKMGKSALYELPWYVIIGPPGSGKTTLLRESNLSFPDQTHGRGVRGVGGTRNCDWWFTDQGILLDTAGRYTTQDEDRNEWFSFLQMLKKSRSRKPINGAMIAISIADIIQASEEELAEHARKIRERLAELTQRLEVVFPVYLLFSKCDLLEGFVETFGGYGSAERAQVWGFTLPYLQSDSTSIADRFEAEFDALMGRLSGERLHNLSAAKSQSKKARIFSFPMQFELLKARLRSFLSQLEQPNPYHESSDIRGFYFTSGTQEGQPFDQVLQSMRDACGLTEDAESMVEEPPEKKAYFIDDVFTDVVFQDKDLARSSASAEKRRATVRRVSMIASIAATLLLLVLLVVSYTQHSSIIERSIRVHQATDRELTQQDFEEEERLHKKPTTGPLDQLRLMFEELHDRQGAVGTLIMGQENGLYGRIRSQYVRHLREAFVEPLQQRLLASLRESIKTNADGKDPAQLYDELRCYQLLSGIKTIDDERKDFLTKFLIGDKWTWTPGKQIAATHPHRATFIRDVLSADKNDWQVLPDETIIEPAHKLWTKKDGMAQAVSDLRGEMGLDAEVKVTDLVDEQSAKVLDDTKTVSRAATEDPAALNDLFDKTARERGDISAETMRALNRQNSIDELKEALAQFGPKPTDNIRVAAKQLNQLFASDKTDHQDNAYVTFFEKVRSDLEVLKVECPAAGMAWLTETIKEVAALSEMIDKLPGERLNRIINDAKSDKQAKAIVVELERLERIIKERYIGAPEAMRGASLKMLTNLRRSVGNALAREIIDEGNKHWREVVGNKLASFSKVFPFNPKEANKSVDTGEFARMFERDGEFDETLKLFKELESLLTRLGVGVITDGHQSDREKVTSIQLALFDGEQPGCNIDFVLMPLGDVTEVHFTLGKKGPDGKPDPLVAQATEKRSIAWLPSDDASIEIKGFSMQGNEDGVDAAIQAPGNWGFIRLLSQATRDKGKNKYEGFLTATWNNFIVDGDPLESSNGLAEAGLLFFTTAEPNPLEPEFFTHTFTAEVFRAR